MCHPGGKPKPPSPLLQAAAAPAAPWIVASWRPAACLRGLRAGVAYACRNRGQRGVMSGSMMRWGRVARGSAPHRRGHCNIMPTAAGIEAICCGRRQSAARVRALQTECERAPLLANTMIYVPRKCRASLAPLFGPRRNCWCPCEPNGRSAQERALEKFVSRARVQHTAPQRRVCRANTTRRCGRWRWAPQVRPAACMWRKVRRQGAGQGNRLVALKAGDACRQGQGQGPCGGNRALALQPAAAPLHATTTARYVREVGVASGLPPRAAHAIQCEAIAWLLAFMQWRSSWTSSAGCTRPHGAAPTSEPRQLWSDGPKSLHTRVCDSITRALHRCTRCSCACHLGPTARRRAGAFTQVHMRVR